ncbi:metallophosphoesterase [Stenotrophomonas rhizophila]|uniref:metallophosphoesterase n=1 Tax=Stenotrophomonas rhizophila TaxID=216778 RepID=UPI003394A91A
MKEKDGAVAPKQATWLHFSDAHFGMREQGRLWSRFGPKLRDDLEKILEKTGDIDFIVFSGDLTQRGAKVEFSQFSEEMDSVLSTIRAVTGQAPKIIAVPGNHDLTRPPALESEAMALKQYWDSSALQDGIWREEGRKYRDYLQGIFGEFIEWQDGAIRSGMHAPPAKTGLMPGDAIYEFTGGGASIGVVALNSAWLQLDGAEYKGKLHMDALQLMELTGQRVDEWTRSRDVNLLISHHPVSWLSARSMVSWERDINPPGRFDLHLFGHMHEPETSTVAYGGSQSRQSVQAASLFGLEKTGAEVLRIQGYSAGRIVTGESRQFTSWPRRLVSLSGGDIKLVPDQYHNLEESSSSFSFKYEASTNGPAGGACNEVADTASRAALEMSLGGSRFELSKIKKVLTFDRAHDKVRRIEQEAVLGALKATRIAWIAFDWGMGEDAFVAGVEARLIGAGVAYEFDFSEYEDRDSFFARVKESSGASFQQICDSIADLGSALVVFSGVAFGARDDEARVKQIDIETLAQAVADFAPHAQILIMGSQRPRVSNYEGADLRPLDEADLAVYVKESDLGAVSYATPDAVAKIMRHTDGVPSRIDMALRDLEVGSLQDLQPSNPDFSPGGAGTSLVGAPPALVSTILELQSSGERGERRAYSLLMALSALPQGEQLSRLKRFFGPNPIHLSHARELVSRSLVQTRPATADSSASSEKVLMVPKLVRDYIRENIDSAEARGIDRKALELYFGDQWSGGDISGSYAVRQVGKALCDGYEIQNMSTLLIRAIVRAQGTDDRFELDSAIRLAITFVAVLIGGDHFRSALTLSEDILSHISEDARPEGELDLIKRSYAECLRMTGNAESAIKVFEEIDRSSLSKEDRQSIELDMALCYKRLERSEDASRMAKGLISLMPKSSSANHARAIIADLLEAPDDRVLELQKVLSDAVKAGQTGVANNVRIDLAAEYDDDEAKIMLREALSSAGKSDFYTRARVIVDLASLDGAEVWMTDSEKALLIEAYYYIYNERLMSVFGPCHDALWRMFQESGDHANLLNLFRHSSFIWRLMGSESRELKYLTQLASLASSVMGGGASTGRNGAYLLVRIAVVLGDRED